MCISLNATCHATNRVISFHFTEPNTIRLTHICLHNMWCQKSVLKNRHFLVVAAWFVSCWTESVSISCILSIVELHLYLSCASWYLEPLLWDVILNESSGTFFFQWELWRRQFSWYLVANRSGPNVDEEQIVGTLITTLDSEGLKIYDTFVFTVPSDARKITPVLAKFTAHFETRRNQVFKCFKFLRRHQMPGETLDSWWINLRGLVKMSSYGTSVESVVRDKIVLGVADPLLHETLLYEIIYYKKCVWDYTCSYLKHSSPKSPPNQRQKPLMPVKVGQWTES